ncbi:MAG: type II/IV secretion system ATPase subunit [Candidatus Thermoplasmatota archaeon]|nr:type II/IV secretion system ATPase subunit [Candidatus Thermoplasmatota archaeon]MCL6090238.1 type II/IV secretion system ATPase subunit [Candidatus Thermoplasmatota archaeon]MDA8143177.1 type II/IV secretion system ATPase subunit [Thermoplasmatales archaeon]
MTEGSDSMQDSPKPSPDFRVLAEYKVSNSEVKIRITRSARDGEVMYHVEEPTLDTLLISELISLRSEITDLLPDILTDMKTEDISLSSVLRSFIDERRPWIKGDSLRRIRYFLGRDFEGYGAIDPLVKDHLIEDISCDGPGLPIFLYHRDFGSIKSNVSFRDTAELDSYIIRLAQISGKSVSVSSPILDGITKDGHRVQAVYGSEISSRGPAFTLRLFREKPFTPIDIIRSGTASPEIMSYLWLMIESLNSALIVGAPGSGKTSALNSLLTFAPVNTKIFSIEETRELNIPHDNWVAAETRENPDISMQKGIAQLELFDLVTMAMRQRPTYIVVGEVRGKETYALFQAMATGHTTYSTIHADSMESLMNRLENEPMNIPRVMITYLNIVVFINFVKQGNQTVRRITEIDELIGIGNDNREILYNRVFWYDPATDEFKFSGSSSLYNRLSEQRYFSVDELMVEVRERSNLLKELAEDPQTGISQLYELIRERSSRWATGEG